MILTIDDDESMLALLEKQITALGHRVIAAQSAERGLELARTGNPDLIVLDLVMPNMDGVEFLKALRRDDINRYTPVMMLTGHEDDNRINALSGFGIIEFMTKPHKPETLAEKIKSAWEWNTIHDLIFDTEAPLVEIVRSGGRVLLRFHENPDSSRVKEEARAALNESFLELTREDVIIVDLRKLNEPGPEALESLLELLAPLQGREITLVGGRHFGALLPMVEGKENMRLFLSLEELEQSLQTR